MPSLQNVKSYSKPVVEKPNLKGDRLNVFLLVFLYVLQGIPVGLSCAIPFVLQKRGVSYADQAELSIVTFAFACKLLWAPIVDCVYWKKLGRRKTWIIPTQYFIGILLILISLNIDDWLGDEAGTRKPRIRLITVTLFCCVFFAATQDIAVDGWSLTMLQRRNVGHSGTCNSVGYVISQVFGYVLFMVLDSKDFCNMFRSTPKPYGLISFSDFMLIWAVIFIVTTTVILIFKKDNSLSVVEDQSEIKLSLKESYLHMFRILKIKPIQLICVLLLTYRIGFGPAHSVAPLKLVDMGVSTDKIALLSVPLLPIQVLFSFMLGKHITGPRFLRCFEIIMISKIIIGILYAPFLYYTPVFKENGEYPLRYYALLLVVYGLENMTNFILSVVMQSFFSRVSDPRFGGMYLTLMNTMSNMGGRWPLSVCLWLVDIVTWRKCSVTRTNADMKSLKSLESCEVVVDGFYIEVILGSLITAIWLRWGVKHFTRLQNLDLSSWLVERKSSTAKEELLSKGKKSCIVTDELLPNGKAELCITNEIKFP